MIQRGTREYALWSFGLAAVLIFAMVPVLWLVALSLKTPATVGDGRVIPADFTFENYESLFTGGFDSPFLRPLVNSILIALIATVIAVTLASFTAYAIARLDFPGKFMILAGALAIAMFPPISVVGPLFDMWRALGLYDTYPGLIIPYLTFALPLAIYTLVAFFREIPWELEQAASVDGATPMQAFTKVILPLAAPGVFTANDPLNLFVAGFIGSPAMNFMPAEVAGGRAKLPMAELPAPDGLGDAGAVIAGVRPEDFEDAHLVGDAKEHGATFRAKIELLESMGSELYAYFSVEAEEGIESDELRELAEDAGTAEVPGGGGEGQVVARLDAASEAREGEEAELWVDATKLHLFDPATGRRLRREAAPPPDSPDRQEEPAQE